MSFDLVIPRDSLSIEVFDIFARNHEKITIRLESKAFRV